jgi:hypothetical protein
MAPATEIKKYMACWMQLGTKVWLPNGQPAQVREVIKGDQYSAEFEALWNSISEQAAAAVYLDGTPAPIQELMGNGWDIVQCARCLMPIAMTKAGVQPLGCPCQGLENWPNTELPIPRPPIDSAAQLRNIQDRLNTDI